MALRNLAALGLLLSAAFGFHAHAAPDAARSLVVIIQPQLAPSSQLTIDGQKVGIISGQSSLKFSVPSDRPFRLRAGRGPDCPPGEWPVFYTTATAKAGQTIYFLMNLVPVKSMRTNTIFVGTGVIYTPSWQAGVVRGEFQAITGEVAASKQRNLKPLKSRSKLFAP